MKKIVMLLSCLSALVFLSAPAMALEGEGTVDEIRVCGAANSGFITSTFFKLSDGQWFMIFSKHASADSYNDHASYSLLMAAYAARYKVKVKANHNPSSVSSYPCDGITPNAIFYFDTNDYIALKEFAQ